MDEITFEISSCEEFDKIEEKLKEYINSVQLAGVIIVKIEYYNIEKFCFQTSVVRHFFDLTQECLLKVCKEVRYSFNHPDSNTRRRKNIHSTMYINWSPI
jgi:hypothetical protein